MIAKVQPVSLTLYSKSLKMTENSSIKITPEKLNLQDCYDFVFDASCGGIALFVGTVRNKTQNKEVTLLDFSTYTSMALKEMHIIANKALRDFEILKIAIHHAEGELKNRRYSCNYCSVITSQKSSFCSLPICNRHLKRNCTYLEKRTLYRW